MCLVQPSHATLRPHSTASLSNITPTKTRCETPSYAFPGPSGPPPGSVTEMQSVILPLLLNRQQDPEAIPVFQNILHAYEVLSDPDQKTFYDRYGYAKDLQENANPFSDMASGFSSRRGAGESSHHLLRPIDIFSNSID